MQLTRQIPNLLSCTRIVLAFLFPFVDPSLRVPLVVLALLTEFFDGYLARRLNAVTHLGQALDPIADKLFVGATAVTLIMEFRLSWLEFSLVAMRDIVVAVGALILTFQSRGEVIPFLKPRISGKLATALQFLLLVSLYARSVFSEPLMRLTIFFSCLSAIDYLYAVMHRRFDVRRNEPYW